MQFQWNSFVALSLQNTIVTRNIKYQEALTTNEKKTIKSNFTIVLQIILIL